MGRNTPGASYSHTGSVQARKAPVGLLNSAIYFSAVILMPQIALYQPDIAQNVGTILRLGACLGVTIHIIEPCGFPIDDRKFRRAGMDYINHVSQHRHVDWDAFLAYAKSNNQRIILLTTKTQQPFYDMLFQPDDILLFGRESAGVPEEVHSRADCQLTIPMQPGMRSINLAMSVAMVTTEALRQTRSFPSAQTS